MHHISQINGITPQHYAVTWPFALRHLIQAHADVNAKDHNGRRPIHLAIALQAHESIDLLLEADCALAPYLRGETVLVQVLASESPPFVLPLRQTAPIETITKAYINRHKRLKELARSVLSLEQAQRLQITEDVMGDCTTDLINQAISACGIHVPPALELGTENVYKVVDMHGRMRMAPEMASTLWESGFKDISTPNEQGLSPMLQNWHCANFEMVQWFIDKGVSPNQRHRDGNFGALHLYAQRITYPGVYFHQDVENVPKIPLRISQLHNLEANRDWCRCLCSPAGCSPVTFVTRFSEVCYRYGSFKTFSAWMEKTSLVLDNNEALWDTWIHDMVRILAFEFLSSECPDLDHTCCTIGQLGEVHPDSYSKENRRAARRMSPINPSTTGNVSFGPPRENSPGLLPLTKCEELLNRIMEMYDEWQAVHHDSVASSPWDFMKDPIIKSRYEQLVDEASTPRPCCTSPG